MTRRDTPRTAPLARQRRPHETGGPHDYAGNPDLASEADAPGDLVQGSDGQPVTGKP